MKAHDVKNPLNRGPLSERQKGEIALTMDVAAHYGQRFRSEGEAPVLRQTHDGRGAVYRLFEDAHGASVVQPAGTFHGDGCIGYAIVGPLSPGGADGTAAPDRGRDMSDEEVAGLLGRSEHVAVKYADLSSDAILREIRGLAQVERSEAEFVHKAPEHGGSRLPRYVAALLCREVAYFQQRVARIIANSPDGPRVAGDGDPDAEVPREVLERHYAPPDLLETRLAGQVHSDEFDLSSRPDDGRHPATDTKGAYLLIEFLDGTGDGRGEPKSANDAIEGFGVRDPDDRTPLLRIARVRSMIADVLRALGELYAVRDEKGERRPICHGDLTGDNIMQRCRIRCKLGAKDWERAVWVAIDLGQSQEILLSALDDSTDRSKIIGGSPAGGASGGAGGAAGHSAPAREASGGSAGGGADEAKGVEEEAASATRLPPQRIAIIKAAERTRWRSAEEPYRTKPTAHDRGVWSRFPDLQPRTHSAPQPPQQAQRLRGKAFAHPPEVQVGIADEGVDGEVVWWQSRGDSWYVGDLTLRALVGYDSHHNSCLSTEELDAFFTKYRHLFTDLPEAKEFIAGLLVQDPRKRMSLWSAVQHNFILQEGGLSAEEVVQLMEVFDFTENLVAHPTVHS